MLCVLYLSRLRVSRRGLSSLPAWLINAMFIIFTLYNLLVTIPIFGVVSMLPNVENATDTINSQAIALIRGAKQCNKLLTD